MCRQNMASGNLRAGTKLSCRSLGRWHREECLQGSRASFLLRKTGQQLGKAGLRGILCTNDEDKDPLNPTARS